MKSFENSPYRGVWNKLIHYVIVVFSGQKLLVLCSQGEHSPNLPITLSLLFKKIKSTLKSTNSLTVGEFEFEIFSISSKLVKLGRFVEN